MFNLMNKTIMPVVLALGLCAGCRYDRVACTASGDKGLDAYLEEVEGLFRDSEEMGMPEMVSAGGALTTREEGWNYEVTYVDKDRRYFSFRREHHYYSGGAHGLSDVTVGTIDRRTGRRLTLDEVVPAEKRAEALAKVRQAVIEVLQGEEHLLEEPTLTENFYLAEDGLHFVFGEYEVSAYCFGIIDIAIPKPRFL